jgi:formylglycine-generating enzyme required for sulfatase activity
MSVNCHRDLWNILPYYDDGLYGEANSLFLLHHHRQMKREIPDPPGGGIMVGVMKTLLPIALICGIVLLSSLSIWANYANDLPRDKTNARDGTMLVLIPAGEFLMGSSQNYQGGQGEYPQHKVYLDAYYISRYEVTNVQFRKFVHTTNYQARGKWQQHAGQGKERNPVVNVSWHDAVAYCRWAGLRLPTEAEWEKAARGTDGRIYPWGYKWDPSRCSWNNNPKSSMPAISLEGVMVHVGSFPSGASPYGILDMSGSVWEWCSDWYNESYYAQCPSRNPQGPQSGTRKASRGGSFRNFDPAYLRCAVRSYPTPDECLDHHGFRVCCSAGPQ